MLCAVHGQMSPLLRGEGGGGKKEVEASQQLRSLWGDLLESNWEGLVGTVSGKPLSSQSASFPISALGIKIS